MSSISTPPTPHQRQASFRDYIAKCGEVIEGRQSTSFLAVRECGDCNMCCQAPAIHRNEIKPSERAILKEKPAGDKCSHCTAKGCAVYQERPSICRGYMCLWLVGLAETPPMQGGVCWTLQPDLMSHGIIVVGHALDAAEVMKDVDNRKDIEAFMAFDEGQKPVAVCIRTPKEVVRFDNTGRFPHLMADIDPADPMKMEVVETSQRRANWKP